jgi:short subunit dehydrogenase-like uncharacterized protein
MIAVYGATGYTGKLVAQELRRRGLTAVLSGRNAAKLEAVKRDLGVDWPVRPAAVDEPAALRAAFEGASVVINCAGPFTFYGAPVIEAAIAAGAHYCDTTGEQPYMQRVFTWFDEPARAAGVAVVPGVGFDYVPGDLAASVAASRLEPLTELVVAYALTGFGATRGTMHSALEMMKGGDEEYVGGRWRRVGRPPLRETFDFGGSIGRRLVARYPGGEVVTVPRHVKVDTVRERITASTFAPHRLLASAVPALTAFGVGPLMRTPLRGAIDGVIDRLPEGPSEDARRGSEYTIVAEARGTDGRVGRCTVVGNDVYGITAVMSVEIARRMQADGFSGAGALAPAQAVDAEDFLGFLGEHGVSYRVESPARKGTRARA